MISLGEENIKGLELKHSFNVRDIEDNKVQQYVKNTPSLCKFYGEDATIPLTKTVFSQHILFSGGIGTGKTNAIFQVVDQIIERMTQNDTVIIFDSKGDFLQRFGSKSCGCRKIVLSNDSASTDSWNMFKEAVVGLPQSATRADIDNALREASSLTFQPIIDKDKNNPFFTLASKNIFYGILKVLSEKYYIPTRNANAVTNRMIYEFSKKPVAEIVAAFTSPSCIGELGQLVDYLGRFDEQHKFAFNNQGAAVLATMRNSLLDIFRGNFAKDGQFSIRETIAQNQSTIIFVEYDIREGFLLAPIYKTIMDYAIKEAISRHTAKRKVFFIIDEFRLLPKLDYMDTGVNFGRSLGLKFIVGIQNILQIDEVYGKALSRSILSGFVSSVNFRTTDLETREYIKSLFGQRVYLVDNISKSGGQSRERDNVITDDDILKLRTGQAIVSVPVLTKNPVLFQFVSYEDYTKKRLR